MKASRQNLLYIVVGIIEVCLIYLCFFRKTSEGFADDNKVDEGVVNIIVNAINDIANKKPEYAEMITKIYNDSKIKAIVSKVESKPADAAPVALSDILLNAGTDIVTLIRQIFSYAWSKGLRLTESCLREVLTVHVRRQPVNRGLRFNLVNLTGTVSRWGVGALTRASAELNPAKPNQEVIRLMFASMNVNPIDPNQAEVSIWQFAQGLKNGAIQILERPALDGQLVYLENPVDLQFLRRHFRPQGAMQVNRELMQSACLGMELFIFEYDMKVDHVVEAYGQQRVLQDSLQVQGSISSSRSQNEAMFTAELDSLSKRLFSRASTLCSKFATVHGQGLTLIGVAIGDDGPGVPAAVVTQQNLAKSKIPSKRLIMSGIESSIQRANELTPEQKEQIMI